MRYIVIPVLVFCLSGCASFQAKYNETRDKFCLGKDALIAAAIAANDIRAINAIDAYCASLPVKGL